MKKEIFDKLVSAVAANPTWYSTYKITNKEGFEVHTFGYKENKSLDEAKALFRTKGYKGEEVYKEAEQLNREGKLQNGYYTFLYNSEKDKISIGLFTTGYGFASKKDRFYPSRKKRPVFAWTKHMYGFRRGLKNKLSPRIQLGKITFSNIEVMDKAITDILYNIDYTPQAWISYRHYTNTKDEYQALESYAGSKIPEVLKHYPPDILLAFYKSLKDYTKIQTILYYIQGIHPQFILEYRNFSWANTSTNIFTEGLIETLTCIHYDLFVLLISNKITEQEYQNILTMSNSVDDENIVMAREIINFKLENGSN